jgi:tetratricopeptide (TPR) repeat protein
MTTAPSPAFGQAIGLINAGRLTEAAQVLAGILAVESRHADALWLLGRLALMAGRSDQAAEMIGQAIAVSDGVAHYHSDLGVALSNLGRLAEAAAAFQTAIRLRPDWAAAHVNLGDALRRIGRQEEAAAACAEAIRLNPALPEAHNNLGNALRELGRLDEATASFRQAIALMPGYAEAHSNLGNALKDQGQLADAVPAYETALRLKPDYAEAYSNLGDVLSGLGRLDEAIGVCRTAIRLKPDFADANFNLAITLLARGDFANGWKEYEWRSKIPEGLLAERGFAQPQWRGEDGNGRTLLLHAEQGFGDTLQFCRYAPLAAAKGWRVVLEVQSPLVRLLGCLEGVDQVVARGDPLPAFDAHCPLLSLPLAFGTEVATIPAAPAYLKADEAATAAWARRLAAEHGDAPRVGLVWAGNPRLHSPQLTAVDRRRSIAPELLEPMVRRTDLRFFSLQKDGPSAPSHFPIVDYMAEMRDFADTAALVANLDLVISVDTAVAHLAAALGRPVWLIDRFDRCWRWLTGRENSPWYPSLRIFRQPTPGDWASTVDRARVALDEAWPSSG